MYHLFIWLVWAVAVWVLWRSARFDPDAYRKLEDYMKGKR